MNDEQRYKQLKAELQKLQRERDESKAKLNYVQERLQNEHGMTVAQAQHRITELEATTKKLSAAFRKAADEFIKAWDESLKEFEDPDNAPT